MKFNNCNYEPFAEFSYFLDNSNDAMIIRMELEDMYEYEQMFELCKQADDNDQTVIFKDNSGTVETSRQILFDLIRNVWDIAYNYGYEANIQDNEIPA